MRIVYTSSGFLLTAVDAWLHFCWRMFSNLFRPQMSWISSDNHGCKQSKKKQIFYIKSILVIAELEWGGRGWEIADRHKAIKGWQWQRQTLEIESSLTVFPHMTTCSSQMLFKTIPIYLELHKWKITNKTNFTKMNKLKSAEEDEIPSWGSWWTAALVCRRYNWR